MTLDSTKPVGPQIEAAKAADQKFAFDLRSEAMGDKAASTAVILWLLDRYELPSIEVIELPNGRTPFMLADHFFFTDPRVKFRTMDPHTNFGALDLHTAGQSIPSLWELNAYLAATCRRPKLDNPPTSRERIVYSLLTNAKYNERRNMDLDRARETIDQLRTAGYTVDVLYDREHPLFPDRLDLTFKQAIKCVAGASIFIGGDTGFSHVAAGYGTPTIALYPDHTRWGKGAIMKSQRVAGWWDIPSLLWTPFNTLPNNDQLHVVEIGSDHRWSIDDILYGVNKFSAQA